MANNRENNSIKLDNKAVISCPYCGNVNRINDLLFRTTKKLPIAEDNRLSDYYYRLYKMIPKEDADARGGSDARRLISWTTLPENRIEVKDGFVVSVTDYDGEGTQVRACVWCHNKISEKWISHAGREIAVFGQPGVENEVAEFFGTLIDVNERVRREYEELRCFVTDEGIINNCVGISGLDTEQRNRVLTRGVASKGVVFFLRLDPADDNNAYIDLDTIEWLSDGVSAVYGSSIIHRPTLVVLVPAPADKAEDVENVHKVLCTRLKVHFSNHKICLWRSGEQLAQTFREETEWLTGNNGD